MTVADQARTGPGAELRLRAEGELETAVLDAEIVDDAAPAERSAPVLARTARVVARRPVHLVTTLAGQPQARRVVRVGWTAAQGYVSWARRAGQAVTHGHVREQIRLARLAGDTTALAEWSERLQAAKDGRARRLRELPSAVAGVLKAAAVAAGVLIGLLVAGGIAVETTPGGAGWADWWAGVGAVLAAVGALLSALVGIGMWAGLPLLLVAGWREGRRAADPPGWLLTPDERAQAGAEVTADTIAQALAYLGIAALSRALKDGARLEFLVAPREQGGGTYFQVRLPLGVAAADLLPTAKVELLAANLNRHKHEVWPQRQPDADARVLDCWVADKGTMDRPAPAWPLLDDGGFDVFRDRLPWGVTMRGDPIRIGMLQKHWLIGANSKQGKTTALRLLLLGLALDPTVELRIADLKGDGDFDMLRPRCHTYVCGQADQHAEAAVVMLEELVAEMQRRFDEKTAKGLSLTRELSRRRGSGFHPIYAVVDECQVMYMAGKASDGSQLGGSKDDARAQKAAKRLHDQARAVNIHLMQATQRPDPQTVPVRVREGAHVRASLYVPNISAARMILADAADRGARPYDLRAGRDAGTVVVAGEVEDIPLGQAFAVVRTHYVTKQQAERVAARALEVWRRGGRHLAAVAEDTAAPPDHLADIAAALRDEPRVRTVELLGRLAEARPEVYGSWTTTDLGAALDRLGIPKGKSDGQRVVRAQAVEDALRARADSVP
ncbi:FtsK/SpoIIIE domain-containing protein [Pseudonocardia hispaniensis]|uniref:FtsK/SpoIIIE domain-containing protein n=1 Tax=Pseudonocardia hispaniensis TaxID=904933 RepID=A0ABW1J8V6_9PSEU